MRRAPVAAGVACLLGCVLGCGDPPRVVLRDTLTTLNELADIMLEVTDEKSAEEAVTTKIELLEKKWDKVTKRQQEFSRLDSEDKKKLADAIEPLEGEEKATVKRLTDQMKRIKAL